MEGFVGRSHRAYRQKSELGIGESVSCRVSQPVIIIRDFILVIHGVRESDDPIPRVSFLKRKEGFREEGERDGKMGKKGFYAG